MSAPGPREIGRVALRREGKWWVAYYAMPGTMVRALELGRIRMSLVEGPAPFQAKNKTAFMELVRSIVGTMIETATGGTVTWPDPPQPAPEHERSGEA